jgi:TolB-like protein
LDVKSRHASLKENINDLDIDYYIEGSLSEIGGSRNINTRLVNAKSESILWDNQYPFGDDQILAYQDTIIKNILIELKIDHSENELTSAFL